MTWQPIKTAPKDKAILAWIESDKCNGDCGYSGTHETNLCLYHAHVEGMSATPAGIAVVEWGGGWFDSYEDGGGGLPDWWFRAGSEFEEAAMPTHWMPLPDPPK
jgi:hypothetical protein